MCVTVYHSHSAKHCFGCLKVTLFVHSYSERQVGAEAFRAQSSGRNCASLAHGARLVKPSSEYLVRSVVQGMLSHETSKLLSDFAMAVLFLEVGLLARVSRGEDVLFESACNVIAIGWLMNPSGQLGSGNLRSA